MNYPEYKSKQSNDLQQSVLDCFKGVKQAMRYTSLESLLWFIKHKGVTSSVKMNPVAQDRHWSGEGPVQDKQEMWHFLHLPEDSMKKNPIEQDSRHWFPAKINAFLWDRFH